MRFIITICVLLLLCSCDLSTEKERIRGKQLDTREWKTNAQGVNYFVTYIEGEKFIASNGLGGGMALAGPLKESD